MTKQILYRILCLKPFKKMLLTTTNIDGALFKLSPKQTRGTPSPTNFLISFFYKRLLRRLPPPAKKRANFSKQTLVPEFVPREGGEGFFLVEFPCRPLSPIKRTSMCDIEKCTS